MASAWITKRSTSKGAARYRVRYRLGGREAPTLDAGSFKTRREADTRRRYVEGEIAALRVPDLGLMVAAAPILTEASDRWRASRVDVSEATRVLHRVAMKRVTDVLGSRRVDDLTAADVADLVGKLASRGAKRETIRKSVTYLAMVLDHEGYTGERNVARNRVAVRLPREERAEIAPPSAGQVEAVIRALPARHRLPALVLEQTGMRVGELEQLHWGDVDEPNVRWRVSRTAEKTRRGRWVPVDGLLFDAVLRLQAREDRDPEAQVFNGFGADRFRTALQRACRDTGTPLISPHDLRHRRVSVWHRAGVSWAEIGKWAGQRSLSVTADTYTHVLTDDTEVDVFGLLAELPR
jgi:integrase